MPLFSKTCSIVPNQKIKICLAEAEEQIKDKIVIDNPELLPQIEKGFIWLQSQKNGNERISDDTKPQIPENKSVQKYFKACAKYIAAKGDQLTGNHEQAFNKYNECINFLKNSKFARWSVFPYYLANRNAANFKIDLEKWDEAIVYLKNCVDSKIRPGGTQMRALLVRCYMRTENYEQAYNNLLYIETNNPDFYTIEKCPDYEVFNYERALCYYKQSGYENSLSIFRNLAKGNMVSEKTKCASVFYCARSHEELGNIGEARLNYQWMISYYNTSENEYFCGLARKRLEYLEKRYMKEEILNYIVNK